MGLRRRLDNLEASRDPREGHHETPPEVLLYVKHVDNARREMDGLDPVALTPEEEALDLESDRRFLEEGIPAYRASPGWQGEEARTLLDSWERDIRGRLEEAAQTQTERRKRG